MLASFMLLVDFNAVSWEGVKFRGRACQRRGYFIKIAKYNIWWKIPPNFLKTEFIQRDFDIKLWFYLIINKKVLSGPEIQRELLNAKG